MPWIVHAHATRGGDDSAQSSALWSAGCRPQQHRLLGSGLHHRLGSGLHHRLGSGQCPGAYLLLRPLLPVPIGAFRPSCPLQRRRRLLWAQSKAPVHSPVSRPAARSLLLTSNSLLKLLTMHARRRTWRGRPPPGLLGKPKVPSGCHRARSIVEFCISGSAPGSDLIRFHWNPPRAPR